MFRKDNSVPLQRAESSFCRGGAVVLNKVFVVSGFGCRAYGDSRWSWRRSGWRDRALSPPPPALYHSALPGWLSSVWVTPRTDPSGGSPPSVFWAKIWRVEKELCLSLCSTANHGRHLPGDGKQMESYFPEGQYRHVWLHFTLQHLNTTEPM